MKLTVYARIQPPRRKRRPPDPLLKKYPAGGRKRGAYHEALALEFLLTSSRLPWLLDARPGTAEEDDLGVDVVAIHVDGYEVPLQVKSSPKQAQLFRQRERQRAELGPRRPIAVVVIDADRFPEDENRRRVEEAVDGTLLECVLVNEKTSEGVQDDWNRGDRV